MQQRKPLIKILLLGDSKVGKTALMTRYVNNKFKEEYKATIGADFMTKEVEVDKEKVILQIWDTAGEEEYQSSLGYAFYQGADVVLFCFDLTSRTSFENLDNWHKGLKTQLEHNTDDKKFPPFFLVGTKADQEKKIVISENDITEKSNTLECQTYCVHSAGEDQKINTLFTHAAKKGLEHFKQGSLFVQYKADETDTPEKGLEHFKQDSLFVPYKADETDTPPSNGRGFFYNLGYYTGVLALWWVLCCLGRGISYPFRARPIDQGDGNNPSSLGTSSSSSTTFTDSTTHKSDEGLSSPFSRKKHKKDTSAASGQQPKPQKQVKV